MSLKSKIHDSLIDIIQKGWWYEKYMFQDCSKFWKHNTFNLDIVNLGSSSGVSAFNYEGLSIKAANWAICKNPLLADQKVLLNYYSYLKEGAVVIIPLCPFTSLSGSYDYFADKMYTILNLSSIPHFSIRKRDEVFDVKNHPLSYYPIAAIISDFKNRRTNNPVRTEDWMRADAENWMRNWMKEFSIVDFSYPLSFVNKDGITDAANILNEIITFCKERKIRPVILIPPVYHTLGEKFTPKIRKIIIDSLVERVEDKTVWYHNYMDDPQFANEISLFQNSFLLNSKGARLFTKKVLKDLNLIA